MEIRLKKKKGSSKICLIDHALRASWLQEIIPLEPYTLAQNPHLAVMAGRIAEGVVGSSLSSISGLDINYFPERSIEEPEIDFVLTIGAKRIPIEVKYQRQIDQYSDTANLRTFIEKSANNAIFGVLITQIDETIVDDPRIVTIPLSTLLLLR
jgi:predicted AAA+ superfamily ATPase